MQYWPDMYPYGVHPCQYSRTSLSAPSHTAHYIISQTALYHFQLYDVRIRTSYFLLIQRNALNCVPQVSSRSFRHTQCNKELMPFP